MRRLTPLEKTPFFLTTARFPLHSSFIDKESKFAPLPHLVRSGESLLSPLLPPHIYASSPSLLRTFMPVSEDPPEIICL